MRNNIKSKFQFDYSKLDSLPDQFVSNLNALSERKRALDKIERLQQQIADLEYALEAESHYIASETLRQNLFPRFNGYQDLGNVVGNYHEKADKITNFSQLALAVNNSNYYEDEEYSKLLERFKYRLNDFIWLFFRGGDVIKSKHLIDFVKCDYVSGSYQDSFPPSISYIFTVFNRENGKAYRVSFTFYDLQKGLDYEYSKQDHPELGGANLNRFFTLRKLDFGNIYVKIAEILKTENTAYHYEDNNFSDSLYLYSLDPIEIAAFIDETVKKGIPDNE